VGKRDHPAVRHRGAPLASVATCSACGAPVVWATTAGGKRIPLDAAPDPDGNVLLLSDGTCSVVGQSKAGARRWIAHHATCTAVERQRLRHPTRRRRT